MKSYLQSNGPIGMEWNGYAWAAKRVVGCIRHKAEVEVSVHWSDSDPHGDNFSLYCAGCEKEHEEERQRKYREEQRLERIERCMQNTGVPSRFQSTTLDNYKTATQKQRAAVAKVRQFRDTFHSGCKVGRSLLITGKVGTGKTHLAAALASELAAQGYSTLYLQANDMLRQIKATWDRDSENSEEQVIKRLTNPNLLLLDEVGTGHGSETEMRYLSEILDCRYRDYKSTVVVTNLDEKAMIEVLGARAYDRLLETGNLVVVCDWDTFRRSADIGKMRAEYVPPPPPLTNMERIRCQRMGIEFRCRPPVQVRQEIASRLAEREKRSTIQ
jgi:DNA replication protein DnaC